MDGVVMISDRKYTDVERTYLGNDTKMYGELTNVIFGCAGAKDMICLFRRYVVGDVTILRGSREFRYTDANLLQKLSGVMKTFRSIRAGADFSLTIMIARLVSGLPGLHVIDSLGNIDRDFTPKWITIGSGQQQANPYCSIISLIFESLPFIIDLVISAMSKYPLVARHLFASATYSGHFLHIWDNEGCILII